MQLYVKMLYENFFTMMQSKKERSYFLDRVEASCLFISVITLYIKYHLLPHITLNEKRRIRTKRSEQLSQYCDVPGYV